jgi:general L-amino acid transport system permease protein
MSAINDATARVRVPFWNDPRMRSYAVQIVMVLLAVALGYELYVNASANLAKLGKTFGYDFWNKSAGFDISQSLIPYTSSSSYGTAIIVGFLNTLLVACIGIMFATLIGFSVGIMRLSKNWLISRIAMVYVEIVRNIPLLLQIFIWYGAVLKPLPGPKQALNVGGFYLSNRGLNMPSPIFEGGASLGLVGLMGGIAGAMLLRRWARARQLATGQPFPYISVGLAFVVATPFLGLLLAGWPVAWDVPKLGAFQLSGGVTVNPEFIALLIALSVYTAAFIAEIVRAGIQAVSHGQTEAASALGLRQGLTTRLVITPQALRIIIPPLTSQYLNLTKNSSLAVAIAYPDLVAMGGTTLNQTGKAIEIVLIWMIVYLSLSLLTSSFMNWFNSRMKLVER